MSFKTKWLNILLLEATWNNLYISHRICVFLVLQYQYQILWCQSVGCNMSGSKTRVSGVTPLWISATTVCKECQSVCQSILLQLCLFNMVVFHVVVYTGELHIIVIIFVLNYTYNSCKLFCSSMFAVCTLVATSKRALNSRSWQYHIWWYHEY